jgi:hypothetical protein
MISRSCVAIANEARTGRQQKLGVQWATTRTACNAAAAGDKTRTDKLQDDAMMAAIVKAGKDVLAAQSAQQWAT